MPTNRSIGRSASTQKTARFAATSKNKKDRSRLCAFTFADGRHCNTPRCSAHSYLCYFHAQKEAQSLAAQQVGEDISRFLPAKLLTACDLGVAMSRLFCAVAQGQVKPKVASTLAYLAQTMLQSIPIAQDEFIHSFDTNAWRREIRSTFNVPAPPSGPAPHPASQPAAQPPSSASSSSASPAAPQPSVQPATSSHTPLPPTCAEFFQQVVAGLQTGSSDSSYSSVPSSTCSTTNQTQPAPAPQPKSAPPPLAPVETALQPGSSGSSSSSAPSSASSSYDSAPARTSSTQPAPSSPRTLPTPTNSLPTPTPPAPPPVPPGFGAPANWDVLIPPKPRRRFSRLP